jgi:LmbE family N-acetylglucosaminyl deacetylase
MTEQHPITPTPELVGMWIIEGNIANWEQSIATQAARWGWDQRGAANEVELQKARDEELAACCKVLGERDYMGTGVCGVYLRSARRPKPPSLKEQALAALSRADKDALTNQLTGKVVDLRTILSKEQSDTIRKALEALPND